MADLNYDYDENSQTWPFFVLTGILVPLVPVTVSMVTSQLGKSKAKTDSFKEPNWFKPYNSEKLNQYRTKKSRRKFFMKKLGFVILGWILVFLLAYQIKSIDPSTEATGFNPWNILGIGESANNREIRTAYRKMSLKFHPDKVDTSKMSQQEIDAVDAAYVRINKAYKALTDEAMKENFLKFGNPDGPAEVKHGIALPKILVEGSTSPLLVVIYILLIAVILPLYVGKWWTGVKDHTKNGIHTGTASRFLKYMISFDPSTLVQVKTVLKEVAEAVEYRQIDSSLTQEKVYQLLMAHLNRKPCGKDEDLKVKVVAITPEILLAFLEIAAAFRNTDICNAIVDAHRCIIQALNIEDDKYVYRYKQILQLPSVSIDKIDKTQQIYTLGKLLKDPTVKPADFLGTGDKTSEVLKFASQIPLIEPLECQFKVPGESYIPPKSHVHIDLRFVTKSPIQKSKPSPDNLSEEVRDTQLHEPQTLESLRNPYKVVLDQPNITLQSLPAYFPDVDYMKNHCGWVAFVIIQKDGRIGDAPGIVKKAQMSNMILSPEQFLKSEAEVSVFKFPLTAPTPPAPGRFQFRLILKNLLYFGSDIEIPLVMHVELKAENISDGVYGIEKPLADSIAGAMAQLRGEEVNEESASESSSESSSDSESESESDSESDWTDIDTDTDAEDEK